MTRLRSAAIALLAVTVPAAAHAQGARVLSGFEYRSMSFDSGLVTLTRTVSEMVVPIGLVLPIGQRLTLDVGTRYASATREARDSAGTYSSTVSGMTDTQVRAVYQVRPDVLVFTLTANLPTGVSTIDEDQVGTIGAIAHDLIPFPVSSFGSGASVTSGLAFAVPVGGWALGLGGSFRMSGPYRLVSGASGDTIGDYKAGAEMRLRVGVDRIVGQGRLAVGFTYSSFAQDEIGGQQLRPGKRYITQASWSFPLGRVGMSLYGWNLFRGQGNQAQTGFTTEAQNLLTVGAGASFQMGRSQLRPGLELRKHWAGVDSLPAAGSMVSASLRYMMPLGDRLMLLPNVRYDVGSVVNDAQDDIGFSGLNAGITLRVNW